MKLESKSAKYLAETIGTFCLVFTGTTAIVVNHLSGGTISHLGISLVFGLIVLAMIYSIGHISGAHINPAVTLAFWSVGRISAKEIIPYLGSQLLGASLASLCVAGLFGRTTSNLGATLPANSVAQSFLLEGLLTFILMFVIMGVAHDDRAEGAMAGIAIGATVALEAVIGGPISGASMNPARSFGPALVSLNFNSHWIYWAAPMLGSMLAAKIYTHLKVKNE